MSKRCPSCGYGPIGPFIDNCPICAEPVRNVRSGGYSRGGGPAPWLKWVIGGAVAVVLSVAGCCGLFMWRMGGLMQDAQKAMVQAKADMEADRRARTVAVSAADLLREFQTDPAAADRKFQGKYLELTGVVERTGRDRNGISFAVLRAGDAGAKVKVECFFDDYLQGPPNDGRIARLTEGQKVTVRGEYTGQVSNVQVHQCSLVE